MNPAIADKELLIERLFDAPPSVVFALWTQAEHFMQWMGPGSFQCPEASFDLRVGGAYRAVIRSAEHGENWFGGVYREIVPDQRLVFTFTWDNNGPSAGMETLVTITLTEIDGRTLQSFHQAPFANVERRDSHVGGWTGAFDKLHAYANTITLETTP